MKLEFKPVRKTIRLSEYAEELGDATIPVRVNVSRETISRMTAVTSETPEADFLGMLAELWGESWPIADIQAFFDHCKEFDPRLWRWVTDQTWRAVFEYQSGQKKE